MDGNTIPAIPSFRFLIMIDCFRFQKLGSWLYAFATGKRKQWSLPASETAKSEQRDEGGERVSREEMKWVMGELGLSSEEETEESLPGFASMEEMCRIFDQTAASAAEVKEAFDVFDVNSDGFIDGDELQRVLCVLGFKEGEAIQNCRRMINKFDENNDGRIDFQEFVKLMESAVY
ncbi:probable calcium-binding protein CML45 [Cucurbita moschata]|uniref:Probable calcium-binding protein CML45 n=1 Tax=Cucurbita moschata TaxID=3662 RepID=A0A6J1FKT4_CUCMO|nr:probable calcium-binding protein CML45 [Cucurbita moschata]